jgi:beta-lactam-binding protein with PASTA domain
LAPDKSLASITERPARILVVAACLLLGSSVGHAQYRKVPGFHAGASANHVEKYLNELHIPFELKEESSSARKGTFLRTEPGPGSELRGETLIVVVSSGPAQPTEDLLAKQIPTAPASQVAPTPGASNGVVTPTVRVPGFKTPTDYREVEAYLTDKGFNVIPPAIPVKNESPAGQFLYTEPRADTFMQPGTGMRVFYSEGPKQAPLDPEIPAVYEYPLKEAIARLRAEGFTSLIGQSETSILSKGHVLRTEPPEGTRHSIKTTIVVIQSSGPGKTAFQQWIDRIWGYATGGDFARFWSYVAIAGLAAVFLIRWCVRLIRKIIKRIVPHPVPPSLPGISVRLIQGERASPPAGTQHRTVSLTARRGPPDQSLMRLRGEGESS